MASLSNILRDKSRNIEFQEENIEKGEIFYFNPGTVTSSGGNTLNWVAPGNGVAIVEIWGASGAGGLICCCGTGVPGNPGAYSRKQIAVAQGNTITGTIGRSCGQVNIVCYRGKSEPTCICYITSTLNGTMCADGGIGGRAYPGTSGNSHYCCFVANEFCNTLLNTGCGIVCNRTSDTDIALATGGDINCSGGFSCTTFYHCNSCCQCSTYQHVKTSPGVFANNGGTITFTYDAESDYASRAGSNYHPFIAALNALSRQPSVGQPASWCWSGARACSCYENHGCFPYLPHGIPGVSAHPSDNVRDPGLRGGHGAVRIKFIGS
jgi:hypothetical protein